MVTRLGPFPPVTQRLLSPLIVTRTSPSPCLLGELGPQVPASTVSAASTSAMIVGLSPFSQARSSWTAEPAELGQLQLALALDAG